MELCIKAMNRTLMPNLFMSFADKVFYIQPHGNNMQCSLNILSGVFRSTANLKRTTYLTTIRNSTFFQASKRSSQRVYIKDLTLVVISYEIYETRRTLVS